MKVYELTYIKDKGFEFNQYNLFIENNNFYAKLSEDDHIGSFRISLNEISQFNSLDKYFFLHFFDIREKCRQLARLKKAIIDMANSEIEKIENQKTDVESAVVFGDELI